MFPHGQNQLPTRAVWPRKLRSKDLCFLLVLLLLAWAWVVCIAGALPDTPFAAHVGRTGSIQQRPKCQYCSAAFVISRPRGGGGADAAGATAGATSPEQASFLDACLAGLRKSDPEEAKKLEARFPQYAEKTEEPQDQPPTLRKATADLDEATKGQDRLAAKVARLEDELNKAREDLTDKTAALHVARRQFQRATKEWEQRALPAVEGEQPDVDAVVPQSVLQNDNLDRETKAEIEEWKHQALEFNKRKR